MIGRHPGTLIDIRAVDIHGAKFYDLLFALESVPDKRQTSRIGQESVYEDPQVGDAVILHLVMGQVTRVERRMD